MLERGKHKMKRENGITLISVVITVIVLLILAGITIGSLTTDNSIVEKANDASNKTEIASLEEAIEIAVIKAEGKHSDVNIKHIIEELKISKIITNDDQVNKNTGAIKTDLGYVIEGKLDDYVGFFASDIADSEDKGQYYGAIVKGYECENSEGVTEWRIFYADQDNIYLIADNSIDFEYIPKSKLGKTLEHDSVKTKSVAFTSIIDEYEGSKDIQENSLAKKWLSQFLKEYPDSKNSNIKAVAYMMDTDVWKVFAGEKAEYAIAGPTIELFCASYQDTHPDKYIVYDLISNGYKMRWNDQLPDIESIYVYDVPEGEFNNIYTRPYTMYWISSPSAYHGAGCILRAANGATAGSIDSYYLQRTVGELRPLVCLKSNVKLKKVEEGNYTIK